MRIFAFMLCYFMNFFMRNVSSIRRIRTSAVTEKRGNRSDYGRLKTFLIFDGFVPEGKQQTDQLLDGNFAMIQTGQNKTSSRLFYRE